MTSEDGISAEVSKEADILEELKNAEVDNMLDAYMAVAKVSLRIAADDGAGHYLSAVSPLTIRDTASVKEKAAALTFIRYLLSEEVQKEASKDVSFSLSVRKGSS